MLECSWDVAWDEMEVQKMFGMGWNMRMTKCLWNITI